MSGKKPRSVNDVSLISPDDFKKAVSKVFSNTKADSDRQLAEFRASNLKKREAKKRR